MGTVKLENGLRKLKMSQIADDGTYGTVLTIADMTQISADTAEGETKLAAGNYVIYSKRSKGATTGNVGIYGMDEETETILFGTKKNSDGNTLFGMSDQKKLVALIAEFTAVNPETDAEALDFTPEDSDTCRFTLVPNGHLPYCFIFRAQTPLGNVYRLLKKSLGTASFSKCL